MYISNRASKQQVRLAEKAQRYLKEPDKVLA
jgi:hypothetical protein